MLELGDKVFVQNNLRQFEGEIIGKMGEVNPLLEIALYQQTLSLKNRRSLVAYPEECTKIKEYSF